VHSRPPALSRSLARWLTGVRAHCTRRIPALSFTQAVFWASVADYVYASNAASDTKTSMVYALGVLGIGAAFSGGSLLYRTSLVQSLRLVPPNGPAGDALQSAMASGASVSLAKLRAADPMLEIEVPGLLRGTRKRLVPLHSIEPLVRDLARREAPRMLSLRVSGDTTYFLLDMDSVPAERVRLLQTIFDAARAPAAAP
jgi:hypothetical protein